MILAIDMGNTNIVIGGIVDRRPYFLERITTNRFKTDLEYAINVKNILEIYGVSTADIEGAIISSVVPPLNATLISAVEKICGKTPMLVGSGMKTGINIIMDNPKSVGADRIVNAVAAVQEHKPPLIIIDMGTATTLCAIDQNGAYVGGAILPGLRVSLDALSAKTAQLPAISLDIPHHVIGKNTIDSMRSGIMYGNAAMLDGLIDRMSEELGGKPTVLATGGLSQFVAPLCRHKIICDDTLLLKGLLILYEKNK